MKNTKGEAFNHDFKSDVPIHIMFCYIKMLNFRSSLKSVWINSSHRLFDFSAICVFSAIVMQGKLVT